MSLDKSELLEKLNLISSRYDDVVAVRGKMDSFVPDDIYIRQIEVPEFPTPAGGEKAKNRIWAEVDHCGTDEETISDLTWQYEGAHRVPQPPSEPAKESFSSPKKPFSISVLLFCAIFATLAAIFCVFSFFSDISKGNIGIIIYCSAIAVGAVVLFISSFVVGMKYKKKVKVVHAEFEQKQLDLANKYSEELSQYEHDIAAYKQTEQEYINEYWAWRAIYLEHLAEEERVAVQLEIDRQAVVDEIERTELVPAQARLNEVNDLVGEEYLRVIDTLISLISSGRADDLKEAINLHEEILYRERQLELEREMEEQRRYEEEMRREEEQRRYEEEMRMHERQERARQEEEMYRRRTEERRQREEARERELQEYTRQAEARREESRRQHEANIAMYRERNATQRQCQSCANMSRCRVAFQRPNCASFVPK